MKKLAMLMTAVACSALFAQETAPVAPAAPVSSDAAQVAEQTAEPAAPAAPAESAEVAATPAEANAAVDSAKVTEPVASSEPAVPAQEQGTPADTAKVAAADSAVAKTEAPAEAAENSAVVTAQPVPSSNDAPVAVTVYEQVPPNPPAAEKKWTHLWGVGAVVPVEQYQVHGKKIDLINYGVDLSYTGISRSGAALHLSIKGGSSTTDNIRFERSDDWLVGSYGALEAGVGFAAVNSSSFSFVMLAVAGYEYAEFESKKKEIRHSELGTVDRRLTESMSALTLGGDIIARFGLSEHVGIFLSVGGRWIPATITESSVKYEKDDYTRVETNTEDDGGVYAVVPAIGAMWKF